MLSILSDASLFSHTKCAGPTIAPTGTICILSACLWTQMNPSTQSAQQCGSWYFVGITIAYSYGWGHNTHYWLFMHLLETVDIVVLEGRCSGNWRIWFGGVLLRYNTEEEGTQPWKELSMSLSIYWTQKFWDSGMISWLAVVYSTVQSSPRRSTDLGEWYGWR